QALACPLFLPPRGRRGSGVNGRPQAVARSAMRSTLYTGGTAPYPARHPRKTAAAKPPPSPKLLTSRTKRNRYGRRADRLPAIGRYFLSRGLAVFRECVAKFSCPGGHDRLGSGLRDRSADYERSRA